MVAGLFGVFVTAFSWLFYNSRIEGFLGHRTQVFRGRSARMQRPQPVSPRREPSSELP